MSNASDTTGDAGSQAGGSPPGLDLGCFGPWLRSNLAGVQGDLSARLVTGGKSNLTYEVTDGTTAWIVRRPPLGHVLATAHDMAREYRVMRALSGTAVPVPATHLICEDDSVIGAPFYVMARVAGTPYRRAAELQRLGGERTRTIALRLMDTLAALHEVDPGPVGLADFGRAEGYLHRQLSRWRKQMAASQTRELPAAERLYELAAAAIPEEQPGTIVHGDFRLDNVLFDDEDRATAVLDWEMATLGDPLADLSLMLMYGRVSKTQGADEVSDVTLAAGYPDEDELVRRYAERTGRDVSHLGFYLGLAAYKLAAILEGIHYRHIRGQTVGPGFDGLSERVDVLLDVGLAAIQEIS
jgi:aminoglycoside phosphotransferase (APT) family kinase protein